MKHRDQHVLVTGGASGIGASIVRRFLREGARVCVFDLNPTAPSGVDQTFICDVSNPDSVQTAFEGLSRIWDKLDVVCNNAGMSIREAFVDTSFENWNRVLAVNLTGPFLVSQQAIRFMSGGGAIINIASVSGMVGMPYYASYNVSKAGVIELTKTLALELAPSIRVNSICPGYVLTPMQEKEYSPSEIEACAAKIPLKRLGKPDEIAALVSYLASKEAEYATGQSFVIDGGETAGGLASH